MRRMSFMLTEPQFVDGSKTVTRRLGWLFLKPGDRLLAVNKCQGLRPGEKARILGTIEVVDVRRELLHDITPDDCVREGFSHLTPLGFVQMFTKHMDCTAGTQVTRIEFKRVQASEQEAL